MSSKEQTFTNLAEIALIDTDDFERFLLDFVAWFFAAKQMQAQGATVINMTWVDDGNFGNFTHVDIATPDGAVERFEVEELK